jgi:nitrile hydratase accessory protein
MKDTPLCLDDLPALPRDDDGPVFNQPWEAKAFALAVRLSEAGFFSWPEWVEIFSRQIKAAQKRGDPDLGDTYYRHWLKALSAARTCAGARRPGDLPISTRPTAGRSNLQLLSSRIGPPSTWITERFV